MTDVAEVDFLSALSPRKLAMVAVGALLGAGVGFGVGQVFLRTFEGRSVVRIATVGLYGPALPNTEVKARAESRSQLREILKDLGVADPVREANHYKVLADNDASPDNPVFILTVTGPDATIAGETCKRLTADMVKTTHDAYVHTMQDQTQRLVLASAAAAKPDTASPEQRAQTLELEHVAADAATLRLAGRILVAAGDSQVLDEPFAQETPIRKLLAAALGAFLGMLGALSMALRPRA
ncbi:MAG: hypothetical protein JST54_22200 [Deltaproteobacteria bacterium]|nr:hypothetical protein [Deltaproteobacteria bacterium]